MKYLLTKLSVLCIIAITLMVACKVNAETSEQLSSQEICNAIYWSEGGSLAHSPFGINPIAAKCTSYESCRQVCINTVQHKRQDWEVLETHENFLVYLSKKYARNHEVWHKNVSWFIRHPKEISSEEIALWDRKQICASGLYPHRNCD